MIFTPKTTDYNLSPYTGLTRQSWIEAGEYMLEGVFQHIKSMDDPVVMPRKETEITYPHKKATMEKLLTEQKAEKFEGLTRTFFIAAPLIRDNPELKICGLDLKTYYKNQILNACTKTNPNYVGDYEELQRINNYDNPFAQYQQTVETCALVIGLWITMEEIWETYTKEEKDTIAAVISSFGHANTLHHNWRMFNMLDLAFLNMTGYPIQKDIMLDHAQAILEYYVGDGWYRDGQNFDYYSCWGFNLYGPLWNVWYGYEHEPYIAKQIEEHSNKLMETYADFFDRDGFTNMWGRSNIYRNAATCAFAANMLLNDAKADPGRARRVCSGSLLQFLTREDFRYKGIPTLGFYGQFTPLVQSYSCAESPFWLGKAFLCLLLPEEHPFWTAKEHNGTWNELGEKEVKVTTLDGPGLSFSNHQANGETILRTGKITKHKDNVAALWNYSKLCFNTKYPWESQPNGVGISNPITCSEIASQQYSLTDITTGEVDRANVTFWYGEQNGVLYRKQYFKFILESERQCFQSVNLADFAVPFGIIRADKMMLIRRPVRLTLGAYGFPDNGTEIIEKSCGNAKAIILKGRDFTGREKQLAMTIYDGWDDIGYIHSTGTNPDSENSIVIYASADKKKQYGGYESYFLISQVITKESHEDFTEEELFPIYRIQYTDETGCGVTGPVKIVLKSGEEKVICFEGLEAKMIIQKWLNEI